MNNISIIGRLVADPELKQTRDGKSVTTFTVAANEKDFTNYVDVVAWAGVAEFICKYFCKGKMIGITGSIHTRSYEDKQGNKRKATEVIAHKVDFCGSKKESQATPTINAQPEDFAQIEDDGDLPF